MGPWEFLSWAVALAVSLLVLTVAIVAVIAGVRSVSSKTVRVARKRRTVAPNV